MNLGENNIFVKSEIIYHNVITNEDNFFNNKQFEINNYLSLFILDKELL